MLQCKDSRIVHQRFCDADEERVFAIDRSRHISILAELNHFSFLLSNYPYFLNSFQHVCEARHWFRTHYAFRSTSCCKFCDENRIEAPLHKHISLHLGHYPSQNRCTAMKPLFAAVWQWKICSYKVHICSAAGAHTQKAFPVLFITTGEGIQEVDDPVWLYIDLSVCVVKVVNQIDIHCQLATFWLRGTC